MDCIGYLTLSPEMVTQKATFVLLEYKSTSIEICTQRAIGEVNNEH